MGEDRRYTGQDGAPKTKSSPGHQDQVGHRGGHGQLEERLGSANVPRLAHTELDEASQAMLNDLAAALTVLERRAVLERSGGLDEAFLGMHLDGSTALTTHTLRA